MTKLAISSLFAILVFLAVMVIHAQVYGIPPKPGPEHAILAYFVGGWDSSG